MPPLLISSHSLILFVDGKYQCASHLSIWITCLVRAYSSCRVDIDAMNEQCMHNTHAHIEYQQPKYPSKASFVIPIANIESNIVVICTNRCIYFHQYGKKRYDDNDLYMSYVLWGFKHKTSQPTYSKQQTEHWTFAGSQDSWRAESKCITKCAGTVSLCSVLLFCLWFHWMYRNMAEKNASLKGTRLSWDKYRLNKTVNICLKLLIVIIWWKDS